MSIATMFNALFNQIIHSCLFAMFIKRKPRTHVHYQKNQVYGNHHKNLQIRVEATFQQNVPQIYPKAHHKDFHRYVPQPYFPQPLVQDSLGYPQPMQMREGVQPQNLYNDLQQQRNQLKSENEQLFANLTNRGYFMARQPSPVILSVQNAEKQRELCETRRRLQQLFQFSNQEMLQIAARATEAREIVENNLGEIRVQLTQSNEDHVLAEQYNDFATLEGMLIALEKQFQQYLRVQQGQPAMQQNEQEVQMSIVLGDIERLNRQKIVLQNCQHGGVNNAFELRQLLDGFEKEYQDLDHKYEKTKTDLTQTEKNISDLTNHMLNISDTVDSFVLKNPIHKNLQHERMAQIAGLKQVQDIPAARATIDKQPHLDLQLAANRVILSLNQLIEASQQIKKKII